MAEFNWVPKSPLEAEAEAARLGRQDGPAGVILREMRDFDLMLVAGRRDKWAEVRDKAKQRFGVEPPAIPRAVRGRGVLLVWSGPEQFLVLARRSSLTLAHEIRDTFENAVSVSDQSAARCLFAVSGPFVRDMLSKLIAVDLHETTFPAGSCAATVIGHIAVNLWHTQDHPDKFFLLCASSYAGSIWETIIEAGAKFGIDAATCSYR